MLRYYKKRSYGSFKDFLQDIKRAIQNRRLIRDTMQSDRISEQFKERIMLAVTAVNDCKYCSFGHTRMALEAGCTKDEINAILSSDFSNCDPYELVALNYAQHYAEMNEKPDTEATRILVETYGAQKAQDIIILIQMISMGNLLGNTIDAFKSRLLGIPSEQGSFLFEFMLYTLALPFLVAMDNMG